MDCLPWLRNIIIVDVWEIQKQKLYDSDSGSGLQLHILSLHPGRGLYIKGVVSSVRMVSLVRMVISLARMVSLARIVRLARMVCLVRKVKCI